MLSESTLEWQVPDGGKRQKSVLVLKGGGICERRVSRNNALPPIPPGNRVGWRDRLRQFDLPTYDRLRVLTTELRRLTAEDRAVQIRLSPTAVLNQTQIQRLLYWL